MRVIEGLVPHGGWHYRQKLVSSPQRPQFQHILGGNYSDLLDKVLKFRLNNIEMVPSGTATSEIVGADINYYICGHWPGNCTGSKAELAAVAGGKRPPGPRPDYRRPLTRIEDWMTMLEGKTLRWVDQMTAIERTNICIACTMNQGWKTGCRPCNDNAIRRSALVRGSHQTGLEPKVKACVSYGTLLELSVWLENDYSAPRRKVPPQCWKLPPE
jgi:hypothetical protein